MDPVFAGTIVPIIIPVQSSSGGIYGLSSGGAIALGVAFGLLAATAIGTIALMLANFLFSWHIPWQYWVGVVIVCVGTVVVTPMLTYHTLTAPCVRWEELYRKVCERPAGSAEVVCRDETVRGSCLETAP